MKRFGIILALMAQTMMATPVAAQNLAIDPGQVYACHANTPEGQRTATCLGAASNICQGLPGGSTTIGISECIQAETQVWDQILNDEYQVARAHLASLNEGLSVSLRDAQRAWIAFRDAECELTYARWQGGSIRSIAYANCVLVMTAERALQLRSMGPQ